MFDNLKESLGRFRKDVEDEVEENAEPEGGADGAAADQDAEATAEAADQDAEATAEAAETAASEAQDAGGEDVEAAAPSQGGAADAGEVAAGTDAADEAAESGGPGEDATGGPGDDATGSPDEDATGGPGEHATGGPGEHATGGPGEHATGGPDEDATEGPGEHATEGPGTAEAGDGGVDDGDGGGSPGLAQRAKSMATGKVYIDEDDLEDPLWDLEMALLENDVAMAVTEEILDHLREDLVGERRAITTRTGSVVEDALHDALLDVLSVGQFDFEQRIAEADKPVVVVFTGVNGVGKTTSIAKLSRYLAEQGYSSVLANGDTYRAGANEQIEEHAANLDRKLIAHEQGGDPAAVVYDAVEYADAHDVDVVLGDTAGRLHTSDDLMAQLEKIDRVVDPDMTLFVDEAVAGQDAVERARQFDDAAEVDGSILTKVDADASGGAAISVAHVTGKPILFLGTGQGYDDIERFDPEEMVERLLGE